MLTLVITITEHFGGHRLDWSSRLLKGRYICVSPAQTSHFLAQIVLLEQDIKGVTEMEITIFSRFVYLN